MAPTAERIGTPAPRRTPRKASNIPAPTDGGPGTLTAMPRGVRAVRRIVGSTPAAITMAKTAGTPTASTTGSIVTPRVHGPRRPMPIGPSVLAAATATTLTAAASAAVTAHRNEDDTTRSRRVAPRACSTARSSDSRRDWRATAWATRNAPANAAATATPAPARDS